MENVKLGVAESACGRMAASAGVVIIQPGDGIEPKEAAQIGASRIHSSVETFFQGGFDISSKAQFL